MPPWAKMFGDMVHLWSTPIKHNWTSTVYFLTSCSCVPLRSQIGRLPTLIHMFILCSVRTVQHIVLKNHQFYFHMCQGTFLPLQPYTSPPSSFSCTLLPLHPPSIVPTYPLYPPHPPEPPHPCTHAHPSAVPTVPQRHTPVQVRPPPYPRTTYPLRAYVISLDECYHEVRALSLSKQLKNSRDLLSDIFPQV